MKSAAATFHTLLLVTVLAGTAFGQDASQSPQPRAEIGTPTVTELGKTVELEFKLDLSGDSRTFKLLCAEQDYNFQYDQNKAGLEQSYLMSGKLMAVHGGQLLLTYKVTIHFNRANEDAGGVISASGSTNLKVGQPRNLLVIADWSIQVTATEIE